MPCNFESKVWSVSWCRSVCLFSWKEISSKIENKCLEMFTKIQHCCNIQVHDQWSCFTEQGRDQIWCCYTHMLSYMCTTCHNVTIVDILR